MLTKNIEKMKVEVAQHIAADAVVQGVYWEDGRGCFIGCLTHSSEAEKVTERFGLPLPLVRVAESIFEKLPADEAQAFFAAIPEAIGRDGKDLSLTVWRFLGAVLRRVPKSAVVDQVIAGMDLLAEGGDWPDAYAAHAAAYAARAAYAAYAARAAYAAYAAHAAARAAYAAGAAAAARAARADEVRAQRDDLLRLLAEASTKTKG